MQGLINRNFTKFAKKVFGRKPNMKSKDALLLHRGYLAGTLDTLSLMTSKHSEEAQVATFIQLQTEARQEVAKISGIKIEVKDGEQVGRELRWHEKVWRWFRG